MFELLLAVIFGFALALFVVLLAAPAVSRRIIALTWRQAETSLPMTMDEIAADRDRLRADHAILARRIEMDLEKRDEQLRLERLSTAKQRDHIEQLQRKNSMHKETIESLEQKFFEATTQIDDLNVKLGISNDTIDRIEGELSAARENVFGLKRTNEHLKIESSNADIERVALETQIDQLRSDRTGLVDRAKVLREQVTEQRSRAKIAETDRKTSDQKFAALDKSFQKLTTEFVDLEERFERNQRVAHSKQLQADEASAAQNESVRTKSEAAVKTDSITKTATDPLARFEALKPRITKIERAGPKARESLRAELFDITAQLVAEAAQKAGPKSRLVGLVKSVDANHGALAAEIAKAHKALDARS